MAELSTLSPSTPALADAHSAPSLPPSSSALPTNSIPPPESNSGAATSSLHTGDVPAGVCPATPTGGSPSSPTKLPVPSLGHQEEGVNRDEGANVEMVNSDLAKNQTPAPPLRNDAPPSSPSPELHPGPNLYPNVHVTHNSGPVPDDVTVGRAPIAAADAAAAAADAAPTPAPAPPPAAAAAAAEDDKPQPPQPAQPPQSQPTLSPKPDAAIDDKKEDPPGTPTRAEHPSPSVPLIHEPLYALPLPSPKPRPAPDTLSYLESASLMSGTLESLSGLGEDCSSVGSDSEVNGLAVRRTDKYGFLGGTQYSESG